MKKVHLFFIGLFLVTMMNSCDNDNGSSPNEDQCDYAGITFVDNTNTTETLIPETDLTTTFYPNALGLGIGRLDIRKTSDPNNTFLITEAVTPNANGPAALRLDGTDLIATVTCQRAGTQVGDEFRLDITGTIIGEGIYDFEAEYCGSIDQVVTGCYPGISFTLDGNFVEYDNAQVTGEIFNDAAIGKFYDIWTDQNDGFYYHSTITENGETAPFAVNWFVTQDVANIVFLNDKDNVNMQFEIIQGANAVGDQVTIKFSGTYEENGTIHTITNGLICTTIDIVH